MRPLRSGACGGGPCSAHSVRSGTCSCGGEAEKAKEKEKEEKEKEKEEKEKEEEEKNSDKIYLTTLTCQVRKTCSCMVPSVNLEVNRWMSQPHRNTSMAPGSEAGQSRGATVHRRACRSRGKRTESKVACQSIKHPDTLDNAKTLRCSTARPQWAPLWPS